MIILCCGKHIICKYSIPVIFFLSLPSSLKPCICKKGAGVSTCTDQHLVQHQDVAFDGLSGFWTIGLSIRNLLACIGYTLYSVYPYSNTSVIITHNQSEFTPALSSGFFY